MRAAAKPGCVHLGLTGGIGSGKSTVAQMFGALGAAVIDADALSRATTAAGGTAIEPIRTHFGAAFIDASGALDRARMRELAFADQSARSRLEAIVHPLVGEAIQRAADQAHQAGRRLIVFDIPLLIESGHWAPRFDAVIVVDCTPETQMRRVMQRSALSSEAVHAIMTAQSPRATRLAAADIVVFNDGITLEELDTKARQIAVWFGL